MPFIPTEPQNGEIVDADFLRNQFNALDDKIDQVSPPAPPLAAVLATDNDAGGRQILGVATLHAAALDNAGSGNLFIGGIGTVTFVGQTGFAGKPLTNVGDPVQPQDADTQAARNAAILAALAYAPAQPGDWAGPAPATLAEALDRLAAIVSTNGANPIP